MKAFAVLAFAVFAAASAAPQVLVGGHHGLGHHVVGGQTSHQSVSTGQGEVRSIVQSKAFGATHASVSQVDNSKGLSEIQPAIAANRPVPVGHAAVIPRIAHPIAHGVAHPLAHAVAHPVVHAAPAYHAPVVHAAPAYHAPVVHAAPAYHAPVVHAAPAYHAPVVAAPAYHAPVVAAPAYHAPIVAAPAYHAPVVAHGPVQTYADEISPYNFNYGVADEYSGAAFQATESNDGTGVVQGSYSVNLPDGRVQTVNYHANDIDGYVAEVTYSGTAVYPEAVPVAHAVAHPVVAHRAVVAHPLAVAHPAALVAHPAAVIG